MFEVVFGCFYICLNILNVCVFDGVVELDEEFVLMDVLVGFEFDLVDDVGCFKGQFDVVGGFGCIDGVDIWCLGFCFYFGS